ncbi:MAG TPA: hypothetical protein ENH91_14015 [Leeuwenhoekiella sp.]|nr:hypothetical protein [Leeuwenhoekiella sp.]
MQEYSRKIFIDSDGSTSTNTETKDKVSFDLHKLTTVERQEAHRAKGLSFGSISNNMMNSFNSFWQKLILSPESNKEADNTSLNQLIIKKEGSIYENDFLRGVLAETLQLDEKSSLLNKALDTCTKIYHEDYPGSYVIAYEGKRLGICFVNVEKGVQDTVEVSYQFNPNLTRFH